MVDSEGCKSVEKSGGYDAKIFALLILISSIFIYNSKGVIDEQSISSLTLATHISEMISFNLSEDDEEDELKSRISNLAPKFVWLLRDFLLSLVDQEENSISPKQYMENVLNIKKFHGRNSEKNSKIREKFLEIFKDRSCFTLPRPADKESELESLNTISLESLRPKFIKSFKKFETNVIENCPVKKINGVEVFGVQILLLLEEIINGLNQGVMPNLHTA